MDLTSLKRLAEAATPGPWEPEARTNAFWSIQAPNQPGYSAKHVADVSHRHADASYIAALSPDKLLKLIAVVEAAKPALNAMADVIGWVPLHGWHTDAAVKATERARASMTALRSALKELDK